MSGAVTGFRVHGSASGTAASADRWSDLDVLIAAAELVAVAEDFARQIGCRRSPVFAADRSGNRSAHCGRLVLRDLRRIDSSMAHQPRSVTSLRMHRR
jgi:hypothetical protein